MQVAYKRWASLPFGARPTSKSSDERTDLLARPLMCSYLELQAQTEPEHTRRYDLTRVKERP